MCETQSVPGGAGPITRQPAICAEIWSGVMLELGWVSLKPFKGILGSSDDA